MADAIAPRYGGRYWDAANVRETRSRKRNCGVCKHWKRDGGSTTTGGCPKVRGSTGPKLVCDLYEAK